MRLLNEDCLEVLKEMEANVVDSIVCDPPYGISILDKKWDKTLPQDELWSECFRVLKPGGHILAFSSARTYHHLAVSIEAAGFDTFNMLTWIYGSGFPKGKNLAREFDRTRDIPKPDDAFRKYLRSAIKESPYRIVELEKICSTNGVFNHYIGKSQPIYPSLKVWKVLKDKLSLDATYDQFFEELERKREIYRSQKEESDRKGNYYQALKRSDEGKRYEPQTELAKVWDGWKYGKQSLRPCMEPIYFGQKPPLRPVTQNIKQWNVGALNIQGCKSKEIDGRVRETSAVMLGDSELELGENTNRISKTLSKFSLSEDDSFFCESKPSPKERKEINHPTLKPVSLMRRLTRLVTPPCGVCLDPFMGSGTTGLACEIEGFKFIGIEKEKEYFDLARSRIGKSEVGLAG